MSDYLANCRSILTAMTCAGPASSSQITAAEQSLDVDFPRPYRAFLMEFGAARGAGAEIYGVFAKTDEGPPLWVDVTGATHRARKALRGYLPATLIPISSDGCGLVAYLDTAHCEELRLRVVGSGMDRNLVLRDFCGFLFELRAETLWSG
jgi:antitoxin YobK